MQNQVYVFFIFILNGFLIGIFFDIFRIFRKSFKTPDIVTYIQDILFWVLTGLIVLFSIFKFNDGELRSYVFFGMLFGLAVYLLVFSRIFIKISVIIINFIKKVINILIIVPIKYTVKFIKSIFKKPISFVVINLRKCGQFTINGINSIRKITSFRLNNKKKVE